MKYRKTNNHAHKLTYDPSELEMGQYHFFKIDTISTFMN